MSTESAGFLLSLLAVRAEPLIAAKKPSNFDIFWTHSVVSRTLSHTWYLAFDNAERTTLIAMLKYSVRDRANFSR